MPNFVFSIQVVSNLQQTLVALYIMEVFIEQWRLQKYFTTTDLNIQYTMLKRGVL